MGQQKRQTITISRGSSPCYGCRDRSEGCHGKCDNYLQFRSDRDKDIAVRSEARKKTEFECYEYYEALKKGKVKVQNDVY